MIFRISYVLTWLQKRRYATPLQACLVPLPAWWIGGPFFRSIHNFLSNHKSVTPSTNNRSNGSHGDIHVAVYIFIFLYNNFPDQQWDPVSAWQGGPDCTKSFFVAYPRTGVGGVPGLFYKTTFSIFFIFYALSRTQSSSAAMYFNSRKKWGALLALLWYIYIYIYIPFESLR